jgi:hypothetical protein
MTVSSVRIAPDAATVNQKLGLIAGLAGTWAGDGGAEPHISAATLRKTFA